TSTFVNRNSFATYAGLGLLINYVWIRSVSEQIPSSDRPIRLRIVGFLNAVTRSAPLPLIGIASTSAALVLTHSRGGMIASMAGLISVIVVTLLRRWRVSLPQRLLIAAVILAVLVTSIASGSVTLARLLGTDPYAEERLQVYDRVREGIAA